MNTKLIGCLSLLLFALSACAAAPSPETNSSPLTTMSKAQRYQAAVQTQAKFKGVDVHWVNLPDEGDLARYKEPEEAGADGNGSR
jgi:starvation-inducible outer membrane lipoprotein